jgi:8-oxo-dGTP pyrophosphatase MutT (NUDIX family)
VTEPTLAQIRRALSRRKSLLRPEFGRAAAVLVPLLPRPEGLDLLFTERSKELRSHAGQVSFPGGSVDAGDPDVVSAALREAREEVGLRKEHVEIIGILDDCPTFVTGYVISPVVGVIDPLAFTAAGRYPWTPSPAEIAALHELPLADFCDPRNLRMELREREGSLFELFWYTVQGATVWGATARIVHQLIELAIQEEPASPASPAAERRTRGASKEE